MRSAARIPACSQGCRGTRAPGVRQHPGRVGGRSHGPDPSRQRGAPQHQARWHLRAGRSLSTWVDISASLARWPISGTVRPVHDVCWIAWRSTRPIRRWRSPRRRLGPPSSRSSSPTPRRGSTAKRRPERPLGDGVRARPPRARPVQAAWRRSSRRRPDQPEEFAGGSHPLGTHARSSPKARRGRSSRRAWPSPIPPRSRPTWRSASSWPAAGR